MNNSLTTSLLEGFFADLQKIYPRFHIESVKGIRPMVLQNEADMSQFSKFSQNK